MKIIATERLLLRPPSAEDLVPWAGMLADPEATRFTGGVQSRPEAWRNLALFAGSWTLMGYGPFSVIERASGRWIGRVGPWRPDGWPGPEIGWALDRSAWGKGYATEAAAACLGYAFDELGWPEAMHVITPGNTASIAVAGRLGAFHRGPGRLPPPYQDVAVDVYGQSRLEWLGRRRPPA